MKEKIEPNPEAQENERIVRHNLARMNTEMIGLLNRESIGGNASSIKIEGKSYGCGAANGYLNAESGEILAFGNYQDRIGNLKESDVHFTLRVAVDMLGMGYFKIVNFFYDAGKLSPRAAANMTEAIRTWNETREQRGRK